MTTKLSHVIRQFHGCDNAIRWFDNHSCFHLVLLSSFIRTKDKYRSVCCCNNVANDGDTSMTGDAVVLLILVNGRRPSRNCGFPIACGSGLNDAVALLIPIPSILLRLLTLLLSSVRKYDDEVDGWSVTTLSKFNKKNMSPMTQ